MADRKISDLTALTAQASGDLIPIVDVSEAAAADKNKSITIQELFRGIPVDVGVGTATPSSFASDARQLVIGSGSAGQGLTIFSSTSTLGNIAFADGTTGNEAFRGTIAYDHSSDSLAFSTAASTAVTIDSSQRLGIGTSTARAGLTVALGSDAIPAAGASTGSALFGNATDNGAYGVVLGANTSGIGYIQAQRGDGTATTYNLAIQPNGGNVGIGTATVTRGPLHLNTSGDTQLHMTNSTTGATDGDGFTIAVSGSEALLVQRESAPLSFYTASTERARITSSGQLLVGTTSTSAVCTAVLQNRSDNGGPGTLYLSTTTTAPTSVEAFGRIIWSDSGHGAASQIEGGRDGGTWTSGSSQPSKLVFSTTADGASSPTERLRIQANGATKISTNGNYWSTGVFHEMYSSDNNSVVAMLTHTEASPYGIIINFAGAAPDNNSNYFLNCNDNVVDRMRIYSDGDVWTSDAGTLTSDVTLKREITDASPKLADVMNLRVRNFYWKEDYHPNKQDKKLIGFVAQEFEQIFPGLVSEHKISGGKPILDEDGNDTGETTPEVYKKGIKEGKLIPILVKALQEAVERIETLEAKVAALEAN